MCKKEISTAIEVSEQISNYLEVIEGSGRTKMDSGTVLPNLAITFQLDLP